jgi:hypothetical protein
MLVATSMTSPTTMTSPTSMKPSKKRSLSPSVTDDHPIVQHGKGLLFAHRLREEHALLVQKHSELTTAHGRQVTETAELKATIASLGTGFKDLLLRVQSSSQQHQHDVEKYDAILRLVDDLKQDDLKLKVLSLQEKVETMAEDFAQVVAVAKALGNEQRKHVEDTSHDQKDIKNLQAKLTKQENDLFKLETRTMNISSDAETKLAEREAAIHHLHAEVSKVGERVNEVESKMSLAFSRQASIDVSITPALHIPARVPACDNKRLTSSKAGQYASSIAAEMEQDFGRRSRPAFISQATTQDGETQAPLDFVSSPPLQAPEPAHVVREKAKILPAPNFSATQGRSHVLTSTSPFAVPSLSSRSMTPMRDDSLPLFTQAVLSDVGSQFSTELPHSNPISQIPPSPVISQLGPQASLSPATYVGQQATESRSSLMYSRTTETLSGMDQTRALSSAVIDLTNESAPQPPQEALKEVTNVPETPRKPRATAKKPRYRLNRKISLDF